MKRFLLFAIALSTVPLCVKSDVRQLIPESTISILAEEASGISAKRNLDIKGPMHAFDYSYIEDKLGTETAAVLALQDAVAYEALNLVDGKRSVSEIQNWLIAEFAPAIYPISFEDVEAYLLALESIGVIR